MKWNYKCLCCGTWYQIDWNKRDLTYLCTKDNSKKHQPPSPEQQKDAYVDTHNWPEEMEEVVVKIKGSKCTVPNCKKTAETLDHRVPWSKYEKGTCVNNLFPMCNEHNQSKGDTDYQLWLNGQRRN